MNITVLNGSPRPRGNTAKMVNAFTQAAEAAGHETVTVDVCRMDIKGCLACESCHGRGEAGKCSRKDDMHKIYNRLADTDMIVLASPIYYHGISGQLKCAIDRFYAVLYPKAPARLRKVAMFLSSGDKDMYTGARFSFDGDFLGYLGLEDAGFFTCAGNVTEETLDAIRKMAAEL